jgi:hypothetical protein
MKRIRLTADIRELVVTEKGIKEPGKTVIHP